MTVAIYSGVAAKPSGETLVRAPDAVIEIRRESDGALASIFSDQAGTVAITNPSAFADANGNFSFYAAGLEDGYRIDVTDGAFSLTLRNQAVGLAAERDVADFGASLMAAESAAAALVLLDLGLTTIIATTNLPAANSVAITDIPQTFAALILVINEASSDTETRAVQVHRSYDNGANFETTGLYGTLFQGTTFTARVNGGNIASPDTQTAAQVTSMTVHIAGYQSGANTISNAVGRYANSTPFNEVLHDISPSVWDALRIIFNDTGNFDGGTYALYGSN